MRASQLKQQLLELALKTHDNVEEQEEAKERLTEHMNVFQQDEELLSFLKQCMEQPWFHGCLTRNKFDTIEEDIGKSNRFFGYLSRSEPGEITIMTSRRIPKGNNTIKSYIVMDGKRYTDWVDLQIDIEGKIPINREGL